MGTSGAELKPGNLFQIFQVSGPHLLTHTHTQKLGVWSSISKAASFACMSESWLRRFQLQPITASALGFLLILTSSWICIGHLHLRLPMVLWETQLIADDGKKYL